MIEVGNLAAYTTIALSLQQNLNDGIIFSIGEEVGDVTGVPLSDGTSWGRIKGLYR